MLLLKPDDRLTANYKLKEFLVSDRNPDLAGELYKTVAPRIENLFMLCHLILQPVSDKFKVSIHISSGYRDQRLNAATKGSSPTSSHRKGKAADIFTDNKDLLPDIFAFIRDQLRGLYFELFLYLDEKGNPDFIHVSTATHNRPERVRIVD